VRTTGLSRTPGVQLGVTMATSRWQETRETSVVWQVLLLTLWFRTINKTMQLANKIHSLKSCFNFCSGKSGLNPTKNIQKILSKFSVFCKFQQIFKFCSYEKFTKNTEILLASSTKISAQKILLCFAGKICVYKISCVYRKLDFSLF
jgi:hypothetical protein